MPNFLTEWYNTVERSVQSTSKNAYNAAERFVQSTSNNAYNAVERSVHDPTKYKQKLQSKTTVELQDKARRLETAVFKHSADAITSAAWIKANPLSLLGRGGPVKKLQHPLNEGKYGMKKAYRLGHVTAELKRQGAEVPVLDDWETFTATARGAFPNLVKIVSNDIANSEDLPVDPTAAHDLAEGLNRTADKANKAYKVYEKYQHIQSKRNPTDGDYRKLIKSAGNLAGNTLEEMAAARPDTSPYYRDPYPQGVAAYTYPSTAIPPGGFNGHSNEFYTNPYTYNPNPQNPYPLDGPRYGSRI